MAGLIYSFAQLEAFTAVAETGSLSKAAVALKKDRTTLRDLVDFLEDGLGYALFIRDGRTLRLTPEGEQPFSWTMCRNCRIYLHQSSAVISLGESESNYHGEY